MRSLVARIVRHSLLVVLAVAGAAGPLTAQRLGVGYVVNAPDQLFGGTVYAIFPELAGLGVFVDGKFDAFDPARNTNYLPDMSAQEAAESGDLLFSTRDSWQSWNAGLIWAAREAVFIYAGAGRASREAFLEYSDPERQLGRSGWYWVRDDELSEPTLNVMGGLMLRLHGSVRTHIGLESQPRGATVGLSYLTGSP